MDLPDRVDPKTQLGPEFRNATCLFNSEVGIILMNRKEQATEEDTLTPVFQKTLAYVQRFDIYKNKAAVKEIRKMLTKKGLDKFQLASLANLCPPLHEEAKSLIPDLDINDEELQVILNDLSNYRRL
eukprot:TRINITY_DN2146_c0_g1_i1.p1 TRINITY_DN2146_c0_g1~~TRINITY_DN2146_c0_g1_i1.p1  ORF type:complete len:140 (-),score=50.33 TRINITY_DN2146_c0_g1_i1:342-722(-)